MRGDKIFVSLLGLMLVATLAYAAGKFLTAQVQKTRVRSGPDFFMSKGLTELKYGQRVEVVGTKGTWTKIRLGSGQEGWVTTSALTTKKIKLSSGTRNARVKAGEEELALAGRGFSPAVEDNYRRSNRRLDYTWVDRMQTDPAFQVSLEQMRVFLIQGKLLTVGENGKGGGL